MKYIISIVLTICLGFSVMFAQTAKPNRVEKATRFDISPPLRELAKKAYPKRGEGVREMPLMPSPVRIPAGKNYNDVDPVWQGFNGPLAAVPTIQNFDGLSNDDNQAVVGFRVAPPDVNMDVGPNHVVEMINLVYAIWDKQGNLLLGPLATNTLWSGFGGDCEFNNDGDPVVLYDPIADRWILTQFANPASANAKQCIACSQTSDPTGAYFRYEFATPGNDYPKLGVRSDAYYAVIRNFSGLFSLDAYAFERNKILIGDPNAQLVSFSMSSLLPGIDGFLPADLDGPPAPPGTPEYFMGHLDATDELAIFEMSVDWTNPANSTLTLLPRLPVNPFNTDMCFGSRNCIPQPGTTTGLDALTFAMMHRLAFRDFGTHMSLVANHTVDVGDFNDHAGIRWYELRNTGTGWSVYQQGTYAPDANHRWMGSIAMDGAGNIALGYTVSSSTVSPSVRFTGRLAGDPLGQMTIQESTIIDGTGSQLGTNRWGDYSAMSVDPSDDATFWYSQEYVKTTGSFNWWTRIGSFQLVAPSVPPTITSTPNTTAAVGVPYSYDADNTVDATGTPPITFSLVTGPAGFTVSSSGVVSWTPVAGQEGTQTVTIQATNNFGSDQQTYTITVNPAPPLSFRINAGGSNYTDVNGNLFVADKAFVPGDFGYSGTTQTRTFTNPIAGTTDDVLYQSIRGANGTFSYIFDNLPVGDYDVTLYFTEPVANNAGDRLFDVTAEGVLVLNDFDIFATAGGKNIAVTQTFTSTVNDGQLNIDFTSVTNTFSFVSAVEVVAVTPPPNVPDISVAPLSLDYGQVLIGQTLDLTTTVSNVGTQPLDVTGLTTTNSTYSVVSPTTPFTVPAGGSQVVTVRFTPTVAAVETGSLDIASNDPDEPVVSVALTGEGITTPPLAFRINAGGSNYTDVNGDLFVADKAFVPGDFGYSGTTQTRTFTNPISGTTDDVLYQSIRGANGTFSYIFDNLPVGSYDVTLFFTEPVANSAGTRLFDVTAEGVLVLNDFDIFATAGGKNIALPVTFTSTVNDGQLNIDFTSVTNTFSFVSAIAVVQNPGAKPDESGKNPNVGIEAHIPNKFELDQNYPNPFNPSTTIRYALPETSPVKLLIFDLNGRQVKTLVEGVQSAGQHQVVWDGKDDVGRTVTSGVYFYRLRSGNVVLTKKMLMMK